VISRNGQPANISFSRCQIHYFIRLKRLGRSQEQIAEVVGISHGRVAQIINNTNFG